MKTSYLLFGLLLLGASSWGQSNVVGEVFIDNPATNPVPVVESDDSAACSTAFDAGLCFGVTVVAGCIGMWFLKVIPGGNHEES
jgi:hypothetical protein